MPQKPQAGEMLERIARMLADAELESKMMTRREIFLWGAVDDDSARKVVQKILSTAQSSQVERRDEIVAICREILEEKDQKNKLDKIATLISIGSGIAKIAQLIIQLRELYPG